MYCPNCGNEFNGDKFCTKCGYNTDKKIIDLSIEELVLKTNMNRSDLVIASALKDALAKKRLVAFLCGIEEVKDKTRE